MANPLKAAFKALYEIAKNPKLLNRILDDNEVWKNYVVKKHSKFANGFPVVEINELIPGFKETLEVVDFLGGGSTPPDLAIIKSLCKTIPECKYFEIGTWRGESSSNAADVCKECYTLNLPDTAFGGMYKEMFGFFSKKYSNITHLYGDSRTFDYAGLNKKFDVVFVDADHHHAFIKNDTQKVFENLLHDNSIVIWHDYGLNPATPRYETIAGILDAIPENMHKNLYHVSNTLSAIFINKTFSAKQLPSVPMPNKKFRVTLESIPV